MERNLLHNFGLGGGEPDGKQREIKPTVMKCNTLVEF